MPSVERLAIYIEAHGGKAITEFKKVGLASKNLDAQVGGSTKTMGGLGKAGATAGNLLKAGLVGGALAATGALVKFAADAVTSTAKLAASIRDVQRITGGTAEEASKLVAILDDFEVPVEVLNKGFFRLAREIGKNDKAFANAGFNVAKNAKGNVDLSATLLNIADAYKATEDPAKRATLLTAAFGRGGAELIPILEQGREKIEEVFAEAGKVGQIFSQDDLDQAEKYRLAMDDLHDATSQFALLAGKVLIPVLTEIVNVATAGVGAIEDLAGALGDVGDTEIAGTTLKGILDKVTDFTIPGKLLVGTILDVTRNSGPAADGLGAVGEEAARLADEAAEADKELDALTKTVFSAEAASRSLADAEESLSDAQQTLADATDDYNKLLKDGAVDEEKVADARRSLAEASRSAADADRGLAKAQKEYDAALANANDLHGYDTAQEALADAAEGLADAQDSAASAHERAAEAAENLRKAQAGDPEFQKKLASALEAREDAAKGVKDAEYQVGQQAYDNVVAHDAETKAIKDKADQFERLLTDLEAMLKLNPAMFPFLGPVIAALKDSQGTGGSPVIPGAAPAAPTPWSPILSPVITGNVSPTGPVLPAMTGLLTSPSTGSPVTTTNNITINAATETDPMLIARELMWNLN